MSDDSPVGMYELLEALESFIKTADPSRRQELAAVIESYSKDFPDEFYWATGAQSPALLCHLMNCIDAACHPDVPSKPRPVSRLVDRKPEGSA